MHYLYWTCICLTDLRHIILVAPLYCSCLLYHSSTEVQGDSSSTLIESFNSVYQIFRVTLSEYSTYSLVFIDFVVKTFVLSIRARYCMQVQHTSSRGLFYELFYCHNFLFNTPLFRLFFWRIFTPSSRQSLTNPSDCEYEPKALVRKWTE